MQGITSHIEEDMCDIIDDEDEDMDLRITRIVWSYECREYRILSDTLDRRDTR